MSKTTKVRSASIPAELSDAWDRYASRLPRFTTFVVDAMEQKLREIGVEPPPRPVPSSQTSKATAARWTKAKR